METLFEWLPRIGAAITCLIGLTGLIKPNAILDSLDIKLESAKAFSEVRGVFGGIMLGVGGSALVLGDANVYLALGMAWTGATAARFLSMAMDGSTIQESIPPIAVDGTIALLALSSQI